MHHLSFTKTCIQDWGRAPQLNLDVMNLFLSLFNRLSLSECLFLQFSLLVISVIILATPQQCAWNPLCVYVCAPAYLAVQK